MKRGVLVSGAAGGIGRELVHALSSAGFTVFAGVLNEEEGAALLAEDLPNVTTIPLDIRVEASVDAAVAQVAEALGGDGRLVGVVNNAGVNYNAPLQYLSVGEIRQMLDVNLLGAILLTRASMPLLRLGRGRVVLTGSATGFMASPTVATYAATKFALEGFGDALRLEFKPLGIRVSVVEPGVVRTPMTAAAPRILTMMLERMTEKDRELYEPVMRKVVAMSSAPSAGVKPERVARAIVHALTSTTPRSRYQVGMDSTMAAWLRHLPDSARDFIQRRLFGL